MINNLICIIPARGGSKEIPKKNLVKISGVPLVGYSIRSAIQSDIPLSNIIVSSDDDEILKYASNWKIRTHKRSLENSTDTATTESCMIEVLESVYSEIEADSILLLQPTSPVRFNGRITDAIDKYRSGNYDSLVSCTKLYPFFWKKTETNSVISTYHPRSRPMRQNIPSTDIHYFENGNIYITNRQVLLDTKCRIGSNPYLYQMSDIEGLQIDTKLDVKIFSKIIGMGGIFKINDDKQL